MGNLRAVVTIASIAFAAAACGDDGDSATADAPKIIDAAIDAPLDAYVPDAPSYDFSCYQNAAPTTATATVQISGLAQEVSFNGASASIVPSPGVSVQGCKGTPCTGQNNLGTTGPTPAGGTYTTTAATTGGTPLDAYLIATKAQYRTNRIYPASPLTKSEMGVPVLMLSEAQIAQLNMFNVINVDPGNALFAVLVTDCATPPVAIGGATLTVTQNGVMAGEAPTSAGLLDPMGEGLFLVGNVPPGDTTVSATYNGMTFRSHVVVATADQIVTTQVKPGF